MNRWRQRLSADPAINLAGAADRNYWPELLRVLCWLVWRAVVLLLAWTVCILVGWLHPVFERWTEAAFRGFVEAVRMANHGREDAAQKDQTGA
jgi:hypothetical protein